MEKRASLLSFNDHRIWWGKRISALMRKNSQSLSVPLMSFFQRLARPPLIFLPPPLTRPNFILVSPGAPCQLLFILLLSLSFPHLFLSITFSPIHSLFSRLGQLFPLEVLNQLIFILEPSLSINLQIRKSIFELSSIKLVAWVTQRQSSVQLCIEDFLAFCWHCFYPDGVPLTL